MAELSRREFFGRGALFGGALWLSLSLPRPRAWAAARTSGERAMFDAHGWKTVDAICARIIPADDDPGAREAGCVNFIDKALAHEDAGFGPVYAAGLPGVDAVARKRFEKPFIELDAARQDTLLASLEDGSAQGWPEGPVSAPQFFEAVRVHTLIGFLADPRYGGNRDHAGWKTVGYPGPRHHQGGYTPAQMLGKEKIRAVWGEEL